MFQFYKLKKNHDDITFEDNLKNIESNPIVSIRSMNVGNHMATAVSK